MTMTPNLSDGSAGALRLHEADNVAIAVRNLAQGAAVVLAGEEIALVSPVPIGHKLASEPIGEGSAVVKFGQRIGVASRPIARGEHVHTQNLVCGAYERDYAISSAVPAPRPPGEPRSFEGYLRGDGRAGTRNYLALVSTVNCSASVCRAIVERFRATGLADFPNVDGVIALTHKSGCGQSAGGPDQRQLQRTLAGFARHPNVFDYLLVGLGCEVNQSGDLIAVERLTGGVEARPSVLGIQQSGGISRTIERGVEAIARLLPRANECRRSRQPASKLVLGTECGGSDGSSGITANPALGVASDLLVAQGGTVILGETPEIYGAEHLLTRRAISAQVAEKLLQRIRWWEWYTSVFGAEIDNNPTPGNKAGGLTTIFEKSLGAVAKGGTSAMVDVYQYAEPVTTPGLVVMDTPGFDPVSVTGMVAGGANIVVFTTGRGSVFGCKPTPSIKVATNTPLFCAMAEDMDLDAGVIHAGRSVDAVGRDLFELILEIASGRRTKSEQHGVGEEEFAPWTIGPVL